MGYKLLGFVVWQGVRLYVRGRYPRLPRKVAIAGAAGLVVAGGVAVALHHGDDDE